MIHELTPLGDETRIFVMASPTNPEGPFLWSSFKDPFPYVGEYGSRHAYPGTLNQKPLEFAPRPEYSQNEEDYR